MAITNASVRLRVLVLCCILCYASTAQVQNKEPLGADEGIPIKKISPPTPTVDNGLDMSLSKAECPTGFDDNPLKKSSLTKSKDTQSARLPTSLHPIHYDIYLQPFIYGNWTIQGEVKIRFSVSEPTDNIILNMADIITRNNTATLRVYTGSSTRAPTIIHQTYDPIRQFYIIELDSPLVVGFIYLFDVDFQGLLNDKLVGFYRSVYTKVDGKERWVAATQFSPTDARRAFPCFDEPSFKATFDVTLSRLANMTALSNMPLISSVPSVAEPGWIVDKFNTTLPMSTYIVGFLICDFGSLTSNELNHTVFKVWSRDDAVDQLNYSLNIAPSILTFLENYFGIPFPMPKLDMAAIPDFKFSGMENWGLIMYRETAMLYNRGVTSAAGWMNVGYVVAHEVSHQWFGNLVTPHWWSDLWLKEGFASFMGYVALDHVEPTWQVDEQFVVNYLQLSLDLDSLQSSHPISVIVDNPDQISEIFDVISYRKGASIIKMMQHFLTEKTFRSGLTEYLNALKYSNAEQDDLWHYLTKAGHIDGSLPIDLTVKEVMDTWTLQMGYPVISVERSGDNATLTQSRFLLRNNTGNEDPGIAYKWWVPVTFTTEGKSDFQDTFPSAWMNKSQSSLQLSGMGPTDGWVLMNVQSTGYYRVNYDILNWHLLAQQLVKNASIIHVTNRAQILDDSLNLARAGLLPYNISLDLTLYLKNERSYVAWTAALNNLAYLHNMFRRSSSYGALQKYLLGQLIPLYDAIGFIDSPDDPYLTQANRVQVLNWACKLGHSPCIANATLFFALWNYTPVGSSLDSPNVMSTALCEGVAAGKEEQWDITWERYLITKVAAQKEYILSALGCSKEIWILARYLEMAFKPGTGIRKQDASRVFGSISRNTMGKGLAWDYLRSNWISIRDYLGSGSSSLSSLIKSATSRFNSNTEVKELEDFQTIQDGELGSAVRALEQSLEAAKLNALWMSNYYDEIVAWLEKRGFSSRI